MRRGLVTARTKPPSFTVGSTMPASNTTNVPGYVLMDQSRAASSSGVLTSATANVSGGGSFYFFTATKSGTTFTIKSTAGPFTATGGVQTVSGLSLSIAAGDWLGFYSPAGQVSLKGVTTGTPGAYGSPPPTFAVGATYTLGADSNEYLIQGTGA